MKNNLYISIIAAGVIFFTSCKKENLLTPEGTESASSVSMNKTESDGNTSGGMTKNGINVGTGGDDGKNGSGTKGKKIVKSISTGGTTTTNGNGDATGDASGLLNSHRIK